MNCDPTRMVRSGAVLAALIAFGGGREALRPVAAPRQAVLAGIGQAPPADGYRVGPGSRLDVHVAASGLLAAAGHGHLIRARTFTGTISYSPADLTHASVAVTVATHGLFVVPERDSSDIPKITATMRNQVLKVAENPEIRFVSTAVSAAADGVHVEGGLTMMGQTRPVTFTTVLHVAGDTIEGTATFSVRQTDFGIHPYSKAFGLVRVADVMRFEIRLRGVRE